MTEPAPSTETVQAPDWAGQSSHLLRKRIIAAVVLAPFAALSVAVGGWWIVGIAALAGILMSYEWARQVAPGGFGRVLAFYGVAIVWSVLACAEGQPRWAFFALLAGAAASGAYGLLSGKVRHQVLGALGVFYIGVPAFALVDLRLGLPDGRAVVLWLFCLVWATDTGAYLIGKPFGRRPLLPRISPNKTWEGLGGGVVAAALVGAAFAPYLEIGGALTVMGLSAALAVVAQAGDFTESAFKRRFGVKDMSAMVPGHGGLLDRLDGLLFVLAAAEIVKALWIS